MSVIERYLSLVCCLVAVSSFTTNTFYSTGYDLPDKSGLSSLVPVVVVGFWLFVWYRLIRD